MPINTAIKVLAVVLESFHRALLITAEGLFSLLLHLFGGTLGVILLPGKKRGIVFCQNRALGWYQCATLCQSREK